MQKVAFVSPLASMSEPVDAYLLLPLLFTHLVLVRQDYRVNFVVAHLLVDVRVVSIACIHFSIGLCPLIHRACATERVCLSKTTLMLSGLSCKILSHLLLL